MSFSFAGAEAPLTIRVCRALIWLQAVLIVLAGVSVILASLFFGTNDAIPFGSGTLTGSGAEILGGVYVAAGFLLVVVGFAVGRLQPWARVAAVCVQVFLAILLMVRAFDLSVSTIINGTLFVAIAVLLYVPRSNAAFGRRARPAVIPPSPSGLA